MSAEEEEKGEARRRRWQNVLIQRRVSRIDHRRPHRWNWSAIVRPLDRSLERGAPETITRATLRGLRFFWLDGLFASISENFYLGYITLFALAFGASNGQIGYVTATGNLLGAVSLFPGARLIEKTGRRKAVVVWSGGGVGRLALLALALLPLVARRPEVAILGIVLLNGLRAFMNNLGNPAWTAMVADLVPGSIRGRYFGSRNMAQGLAALAITPLAGWLIKEVNGWQGFPHLGFQTVFLLAFFFGALSTIAYHLIPEPPASPAQAAPHQRGDLRRAIRSSPGFWGLVVSAFVWNLSLQIAGPFFNVYMVTSLGGTAASVGIVSSVSSLFALVGQFWFGRILDRRGALWVARLTGFLIPGLPLAWVFFTEWWHVGLMNIAGGLLWGGYNLANFNLLLEMTPDEQRPRAVALYQTAVFSSAVIGPLLGGYLADVTGFRSLFLLSGVGRLVGMLLFVFMAARPSLAAQRQSAGAATPAG
jgi:MFS family permease